MGLFGFKEVDRSEEVRSRLFFFLLEIENLCASFPVFGWQLRSESEKIYCIFQRLVSNEKVKVAQN